MLNEMLKELNLPEYPGREEALRILSSQEYGFAPQQPDKVWAAVRSTQDNAFADKAVRTEYDLFFETEGRTASFPFTLVVPKGVEKPLTVIFLNFHENIPNVYYPAEELVDEGVAVAHIYYKAVACDAHDGYRDPVCKALRPDAQPSDGWGKISLWAWAASRVADILCQDPALDTENLAVIGHSRLGKTALLCAARDERFAFAASNCSGCSGASLARQNGGETVKAIYNVFPHWFCPNYADWREKVEEMPFDQHFLVRAIAPRHVLITSAEGDEWAWPKNEFLCAVASGLTGQPDRLPQPPEDFLEGLVGYHIRTGSHYLSRKDWLTFLRFIRLHKKG